MFVSLVLDLVASSPLVEGRFADPVVDFAAVNAFEDEPAEGVGVAEAVDLLRLGSLSSSCPRQKETKSRKSDR